MSPLEGDLFIFANASSYFRNISLSDAANPGFLATSDKSPSFKTEAILGGTYSQKEFLIMSNHGFSYLFF